MSNYAMKITDFVYGDAFELRLRVDLIPDGVTVDKAWFTVKSAKDNDAADTTKVLQKSITTVLSADGQIVEAGTGVGVDRYAIISFKVLPADTFALDPNLEYVWDAQIRLSTGATSIYTPFMGTLKGLQGVTNKTT